jgi:hypothetical protein
VRLDRAGAKAAHLPCPGDHGSWLIQVNSEAEKVASISYVDMDTGNLEHNAYRAHTERRAVSFCGPRPVSVITEHDPASRTVVWLRDIAAWLEEHAPRPRMRLR